MKRDKGGSTMKGPVRQAHLQRDVLLELELSPAGSVVELAERLQKTRASVSRALHTLSDREQVDHAGRGWQLSPQGRQVAADIQTGAFDLARQERGPAWERSLGLEAASTARTLSGFDGALAARTAAADLLGLSRSVETTARIGAMLERSARMVSGLDRTASVAAKVFADMPPQGSLIDLAGVHLAFDVAERFTHAANAPQAWQASPALESLGAKLAQQAMYTSGAEEMSRRLRAKMDALTGIGMKVALGEKITSGLSRELSAGMKALAGAAAPALGAALAEAAAAQRSQLDAVAGGIAAKAWWTPLVADTLPRTAAMLSDLASMEARADATRGYARRLAGPLSVASADVVTSHRRHLTAILGGLATAPPMYREAAIHTLVMPTASTAEFVGGARRFLEPRRRGEAPDVELEARTVDLADRLGAIHPALRSTFLGAWERVAQGGSDWQRAAAHAAREVLGQALTHLAPQAPPDPATGKPTRTTRLRALLGESETKLAWVDAQVAGLEMTFTLLHAEAHEREASRFDSRLAMVGMLRSVEGVLWVIIETDRRDP